MNYGRIEGIDKPVSRLVQGTMMCHTATQVQTNALLDAAFAQGINTFDTAHIYGSGDSERSVGRWINERGLRQEVVIIGKGAHPSQDRRRVTPFDISTDIHDSLARFKIGTIDLYLLHRDDTAVPIGPIVERLHQHREAGHIQAYGGSNWSPQRLAQANEYAAQHGLSPFVASSPNFSLAVQAKAPWDGCVSISGPKEQTARDWYAGQQMPLFTWSSLASGFFSGRFRRDNLDTFDNYLDKVCVATYCFEENWWRLERTQQLAAKKGVSVPQIALAYVLNQPLNIYAIIGCRNQAEVMENVQAVGLQLTAEELAWLAE